MTTMSAAQYLPLAELRRRDLSNAFGVTFQIWENDLDWRCQDYAIATPPDLARWFDNLASQNLEAALTDQLYSEPIDHELWIAAPIWQESENQLLMLAAPMPADPAVMIRICANLYARTQLQATQLDDQQTLIDSYANHMSANYEEIYFLRQLSKSIEFCDATRDLNSVAASILPALLPLMGAAAVEFIPSSVAVAFASEDETATEIREG